jgi:hypothetical protein
VASPQHGPLGYGPQMEYWESNRVIDAQKNTDCHYMFDRKIISQMLHVTHHYQILIKQSAPPPYL